MHYDLRVRGGTLESDILESRKRIVNVVDVIESLHSLEADDELPSTSVGAYFNLTADFNDALPIKQQSTSCNVCLVHYQQLTSKIVFVIVITIVIIDNIIRILFLLILLVVMGLCFYFMLPLMW